MFACWFNSLYIWDIWFNLFLHVKNATEEKMKNEGDQERLLQKFYDNFGNEEKVFENEDNVDFAGEKISGSDSDPDDKIDMELDGKTPSVAAVIDDPTPVCKLMFSNLEKVIQKVVK